MLKSRLRHIGAEGQVLEIVIRSDEKQQCDDNLQENQQAETAARYKAGKWLCEKSLFGFGSLWLYCLHVLYNMCKERDIFTEHDIFYLTIFAFGILSFTIIAIALCFIFCAGRGDKK